MPELRFATVETRGRQDVLISWILRLGMGTADDEVELRHGQALEG